MQSVLDIIIYIFTLKLQLGREIAIRLEWRWTDIVYPNLSKRQVCSLARLENLDQESQLSWAVLKTM